MRALAAVTSIERVRAEIALQRADRIPVAPQIVTHAQTVSGIPLGKLFQDPVLMNQAIERSLEVYGDYDIIPHSLTLLVQYMRLVNPFKAKIPGRNGWPEDREPQVLDEEILMEEDYDIIAREGFLRRILHLLHEGKLGGSSIARWKIGFVLQGLPRPFFTPVALRFSARQFRAITPLLQRWWQERQKWVYSGAQTIPPFEALMILRSVTKGMIDLMERPEKVLAATKVIVRESLEKTLNETRTTGIPTSMIGGAHASNTYISPRMYSRFDLPFTLEVVNGLVEAGITPVLHYDSNWIHNLPLMREFPAKKCILHLDGFTDIRKAKEAVGDRMAIMGDVPPQLMTQGTKDQVATYCRELIRDVGRTGGFILACGCECPVNARAENVSTLIEIACEEGRA